MQQLEVFFGEVDMQTQIIRENHKFPGLLAYEVPFKISVHVYYWLHKCNLRVIMWSCISGILKQKILSDTSQLLISETKQFFTHPLVNYYNHKTSIMSPKWIPSTCLFCAASYVSSEFVLFSLPKVAPRKVWYHSNRACDWFSPWDQKTGCGLKNPVFAKTGDLEKNERFSGNLI